MGKILVGADPELFVKKDGQLVTASGLVPGTKAKPFPVKHGAVQVDGMALEFNIDPARDDMEFVNNILTVMAELKRMVPDHEFLIEATVRFKDTDFHGLPEAAIELGCEPDYNAYTEMVNLPPDRAVPNMRTAAGHIHVGWTEGVEEPTESPHMDMCIALAKQMDLFLGVPFVLLNDCPERKAMYGKAGSYRPKPYGMEYRTLSNRWLLSGELMFFVYRNTIRAVEELMEEAPLWLTITDGEAVVNNSDRGRAEEIVDELAIHMGAVI